MAFDSGPRGDCFWAHREARSLRDLTALANRFNRRHIQVVGYNNGVRHFGHRYPGRTVVSTVACNRIVRAGSDSIRADCGVTVRQALDFLAKSGQEMYVVPNYSYVCLGTAFFVPIHGSASAFSTIADTIVEGVLFDPDGDRVIRARQDEQAFRDLLFNLRSDWLVLQVRMIVKPKSAYYCRIRQLAAPSAEEILSALCDRQAANVEVRGGRRRCPCQSSTSITTSLRPERARQRSRCWNCRAIVWDGFGTGSRRTPLRRS